MTIPEPPESTEFCRLSKDDLIQVVKLERQCFSTPWSEKQFSLAFTQKIFNVFGLKQNETLMAYLAFYHTVDEMEILNIAVSPEYRRYGYGTRLLGLVLQIGRKMGIHNAFLEVREHNTAAKTLYANFGFQQVGIRKKYYTDTGEDALVMHLEMHEV